MNEVIRPVSPAMTAVLRMLPEAPAPGITLGALMPLMPEYSESTLRMSLLNLMLIGFVERVGYQRTRSGPGGQYAVWRRVPASPGAALVMPPPRLTGALEAAANALPVAPAPGILLTDVAKLTGYALNTVRRAVNELRWLGLAERAGSTKVKPGRAGVPVLWRRPPADGGTP